MITFFAILLAGVGFAFVGYPLLKPRPQMVEADEGGAIKELDSKKDTTYAMLKELEFDYHTGVLSEEDYQELQERYKNKAVAILKEAEKTQKNAAAVQDEIEREIQGARRRRPLNAKAGNVDVEIEREVARLRRSKAPAPAVDVEQEIVAQREGRKKFCTKCGSRLDARDEFCPECGVKL